MSVQQFDVIVVGAGFGGMGAAIQLKKMGYDNILILDREDDLGGTWHVNHYPGSGRRHPVDDVLVLVRAQPALVAAVRAGRRTQALRRPRRRQVRRAPAHAVQHPRRRRTLGRGRPLWQVALSDGDTLTSRFLITATGFLSQPRNPTSPASTTSPGRSSTARHWDDELLPRRRRVGSHRHRRDRGPAHPRADQDRPPSSPCTSAPRSTSYPRSTSRFRERARRLFARIPLTQRAFAVHTDINLEVMMILAVIALPVLPPAQRRRGRPVADAAVRVDPRQGAARKLTPDYDFGCKRPTYSNSYYRDLHQAARAPADPTASSASRPTASSRRRNQDRDRHAGAGTGFDLWEANIPAIEIIGRDGRNLGKWWRDNGFQAYQGVTIPYFPNFLSLASPYRVPRAELLQHDGIPDAAHGPVVR